MEKFKIDHFEREYSEKKFPLFKKLDSNSADQKFFSIANHFALQHLIDNRLNFMKEFKKLGAVIRELNAEDENFNFLKVLQRNNISPRDKIFINWNRFDNIDEFNTKDFSSFFNYIWYPGPDDIDVFDDSHSWILNVDESGYLKLILPSK